MYFIWLCNSKILFLELCTLNPYFTLRKTQWNSYWIEDIKKKCQFVFTSKVQMTCSCTSHSKKEKEIKCDASQKWHGKKGIEGQDIIQHVRLLMKTHHYDHCISWGSLGLMRCRKEKLACLRDWLRAQNESSSEFSINILTGLTHWPGL